MKACDARMADFFIVTEVQVEIFQFSFFKPKKGDFVKNEFIKSDFLVEISRK